MNLLLLDGVSFIYDNSSSKNNLRDYWVICISLLWRLSPFFVQKQKFFPVVSPFIFKFVIYAWWWKTL